MWMENSNSWEYLTLKNHGDQQSQFACDQGLHGMNDLGSYNWRIPRWSEVIAQLDPALPIVLAPYLALPFP